VDAFGAGCESCTSNACLTRDCSAITCSSGHYLSGCTTSNKGTCE
jgi:hypothetical protein